MSRDDVETADQGDEDEPLPTGGDADDGQELDQEIGSYLRLGLPLATIVCAIVGGVLQGAAAVVLVLAAGALVSVIAIFWASIRTLVGETPLSGADAYALGAPHAEEEQKRAVLRGLKDLEFEHSVGKISEEDYQALVARYRAEAKRLLRIIDDHAAPGRQKVEDLVAARLFREGLTDVPPEPYRGGKPDVKAAKKKKLKPAKGEEAKPVGDAASPPTAEPEKAETETRLACASCGTRNDPDAVFCKKCGARQGAPPAEKPAEHSAEHSAEKADKKADKEDAS